MIRKLAGAVEALRGIARRETFPRELLAVGFMLVAGSLLQALVDERVARLGELDAQLVEREARLHHVKTELGAAMGAQVPYPTSVDVDPLHRADNGDAPAAGIAAAAPENSVG